MAAINQTSWRDRAMDRAEGITDAWEVTKNYAGRLAEWVLFFCMIACIVEILPGVNIPVWMSNTVLGVQAVMLDIGGFALSGMADRARGTGETAAARKADRTGRFLIGIVILTLTLITIGILYAPARQYTDGGEKILILVRVIMTVVYGHVIHDLRRVTSRAITPIQVATFEARIEEQVAQISATLTSQVAQKISSISEEVAQEVAFLGATMTEGVSSQFDRLDSRLSEVVAQNKRTDDQDAALMAEQIARLMNELAGVRREVRTTVTEIRSFVQESPAIPQLSIAVVEANEGAGDRVKSFLQQWSSPKKPTIQNIVEGCGVAKKTATRYRNEYYGMTTSSPNEDDE